MIDPGQPASAPLAEPVLLAEPCHQSSPCRRLQPFFPKMSLSAALSSIASASSFFSRRFSSSSPLSRLASATSMPPYFAFHLHSVASAIPCLRHTSAVLSPASASRKIPMICSSLYRLPFFCPSPSGDELYGNSRGFSEGTPPTLRALRDERGDVQGWRRLNLRTISDEILGDASIITLIIRRVCGECASRASRPAAVLLEPSVEIVAISTGRT